MHNVNIGRNAPKMCVFYSTVRLDLYIREVAEEVPQHVGASSTVRYESEIVGGNLTTDAFKEQSPRVFVGGVAIDQNSIHIEDHRPQWNTHESDHSCCADS